MEAYRESEASLKKQYVLLSPQSFSHLTSSYLPFLAHRFYTLTNPTLYLDGLCVDFRYQRRGIGKELLATGLNLARVKGLDIWTEASPSGLGLYLKMGFKQVSEFVVEDPEGGEGVKMPVLKFAAGV